ncbi:hypothetical protein BDW22DRAFT_340012 [Trametopsis cervina]|nr:hypothetical protein BDW22DRAFT_340012 [Trametopsis cervina]
MRRTARTSSRMFALRVDGQAWHGEDGQRETEDVPRLGMVAAACALRRCNHPRLPSSARVISPPLPSSSSSSIPQRRTTASHHHQNSSSSPTPRQHSVADSGLGHGHTKTSRFISSSEPAFTPGSGRRKRTDGVARGASSSPKRAARTHCSREEEEERTQTHPHPESGIDVAGLAMCPVSNQITTSARTRVVCPSLSAATLPRNPALWFRPSASSPRRQDHCTPHCTSLHSLIRNSLICAPCTAATNSRRAPTHQLATAVSCALLGTHLCDERYGYGYGRVHVPAKN